MRNGGMMHILNTLLQSGAELAMIFRPTSLAALQPPIKEGISDLSVLRHVKDDEMNAFLQITVGSSPWAT